MLIYKKAKKYYRPNYIIPNFKIIKKDIAICRIKKWKDIFFIFKQNQCVFPVTVNMMEAIPVKCARTPATTLQHAVSLQLKKGMVHQLYAINVKVNKLCFHLSCCNI